MWTSPTSSISSSSSTFLSTTYYVWLINRRAVEMLKVGALYIHLFIRYKTVPLCNSMWVWEGCLSLHWVRTGRGGGHILLSVSNYVCIWFSSSIISFSLPVCDFMRNHRQWKVISSTLIIHEIMRKHLYNRPLPSLTSSITSWSRHISHVTVTPAASSVVLDAHHIYQSLFPPLTYLLIYCLFIFVRIIANYFRLSRPLCM